MNILQCTREDFFQIYSDLEDFWGSDRTRTLHHPTLIYEFGNSAFVIKENEKVIAYLFGFYSQTEPVAYIHLIGVRSAYQRHGLGKILYDHFENEALGHGCTTLKAITSPTNSQSISFHEKIGMLAIGEPDENGIPIIKDYAGIGLHKVVFIKQLTTGSVNGLPVSDRE